MGWRELTYLHVSTLPIDLCTIKVFTGRSKCLARRFLLQSTVPYIVHKATLLPRPSFLARQSQQGWHERPLFMGINRWALDDERMCLKAENRVSKVTSKVA